MKSFTRVSKRELKKFIDDADVKIDCSKIPSKLQGADITACSSGKSFPNGMNALMYAIMKKKTDIVYSFLSFKDIDLLATDNFGQTALHYAVGIPFEHKGASNETHFNIGMAYFDSMENVDTKLNDVVSLSNLDPILQAGVRKAYDNLVFEREKENETKVILRQVLEKYKKSNISIDTIGAGRSAFGLALALALKTEFWSLNTTFDNKYTFVPCDSAPIIRARFGRAKFNLAVMFTEYNCDPNATYEKSNTPIEEAIAANLPISYMEKITKSAGYADINGHGGNTLSTAIKSTAKKSPEKRRESVDQLAVLVSNGYVPKNKKDANRLMNIGVEEQKPELVKVAQQSGANPYKPGIDGKSPAEKNNAIRRNDLFNFRVKVTSYFVFGGSTGATFSLILIPIFLKASFLYDALALSTYVFTLIGGIIGIAFACIKLPEHHDEEYEIDSSFSETSSISSTSISSASNKVLKQAAKDANHNIIIRAEESIDEEKYLQSSHSRNSGRNDTTLRTNVTMHTVASNISSTDN
ncbi:MAG: ankyrin repeat domain-containing protein [Pseudomonadota bacterium]|nr:ankyrin repeat domain-containing protein [Pseudomonadota bacterium]